MRRHARFEKHMELQCVLYRPIKAKTLFKNNTIEIKTSINSAPKNWYLHCPLVRPRLQHFCFFWSQITCGPHQVRLPTARKLYKHLRLMIGVGGALHGSRFTLSYKLGTPAQGGTSHSGLALPHQPVIKKMTHRLAHRPI